MKIIILALMTLSVISTAKAAAPAPPLRQKVNVAIDTALAEHRIVGAVVIIARDGKVLYQRAAGFADRETKRPMKLDTIFRLSTACEPVAAAAVLALTERGAIALNDPVTKYLPEFQPRLPNADVPEITIRELLTHTAGLGYKFQEKPEGPYHRAKVSDGFDDQRLSLEENLKRISNILLTEEPGTMWRYSLSNDVLGAVIAKASGKSLPAAVAELITTPLGMRDTAFIARNPDRLAVPYYNAEPDPKPMADPQRVPFSGGELIYSPSRALDDKAYPSAGAGMIGTASDLLRLLEALRKGGAPILSKDSAQAMMSNQIGKLQGPRPGLGFGFGGAVVIDPSAAQSPQSPGTWLWGGVYGHSWFVDPMRKLTVILLTNTALEGMTGQLPADLRDAVYSSGI
jgi:CubicO group peptidase (beta-lactamase class C family)